MRSRKVVLAASFLFFSTTALSQVRDELQDWIAQRAVAVRSIDAADEDFSDLEPLRDAIDTAQLVQLGEPSHGSGSSFAAKVRLVKFLHQRMGFDVLVWESGMHGLRLTQAGMRAGEDPVVAARRGIFTIWSNTKEVKPLLEYVKASQSSTRPIEMAGFDMQFTARDAAERFADDLRAFVSRVSDSSIRDSTQQLAERAIAAYRQICCARREARSRMQADLAKAGKAGKDLEKALSAWDKSHGARLRPTEDDLRALNEATDDLLLTIGDHRSVFEQVHGPTEVSFLEHAIKNMQTDGAGKVEIVPGAGGSTAAAFRDATIYFNRRDALNARNLRWLVNKAYAGRKVIVWAHNVHLANAYFEPDFRAMHLEAQPRGMKPMGTYIADWFGERAYTIAFTSYAGRDGWATSNAATSIPPAPSESLETRLHALDKPYLFLNLRTPGTEPTHPLHSPQSVRVFIPAPGSSTVPAGNGNYTVADITKVFDALFYIDQAEPATRLE